PVFRRALAGAHADLDRLLRHRHIREHSDPNLADALHFAREGAAGSLDLARSHAVRLQRLKPARAEVERVATLGLARDAALEGLAVFCALGLQHRLSL